MGLRPDWPNLGVISMAYSYGFSNLVLPLLLHGIPLFLAPAPLPEVLRGAAQQRRSHRRRRARAVARVAQGGRDFAQRAARHFRRRAAAADAGARGIRGTRRQDSQFLRLHRMWRHRLRRDFRSAHGRNFALAVRSTMSAWKSVPSGVLLVRSRAVGETYWPDAGSRGSATAFFKPATSPNSRTG